MNKQAYKKLIDVHFSHQLWRNELEMADHELQFLEHLFSEIDPTALIGSSYAPSFSDLLGQTHHFQRVVTQLRSELQEVEKGLATDLQLKDKIDSETRKDHAYLREVMDDFHKNYRTFIHQVRTFIVA